MFIIKKYKLCNYVIKDYDFNVIDNDLYQIFIKSYFIPKILLYKCEHRYLKTARPFSQIISNSAEHKYQLGYNNTIIFRKYINRIFI